MLSLPTVLCVKVWVLMPAMGGVFLLAVGSRFAAGPAQAGSWNRQVGLYEPELLNFGIK